MTLTHAPSLRPLRRSVTGSVTRSEAPRRARQATKAERELTDSELLRAKYLVSRMRRCFYTPFGRRMTYGSGIDPEDSDAIEKVARRIRDHKSELKAKAKARAEQGMMDAAECEALHNDWEYSRWPKKIFTWDRQDAANQNRHRVWLIYRLWRLNDHR